MKFGPDWYAANAGSCMNWSSHTRQTNEIGKQAYQRFLHTLKLFELSNSWNGLPELTG